MKKRNTFTHHVIKNKKKPLLTLKRNDRPMIALWSKEGTKTDFG